MSLVSGPGRGGGHTLPTELALVVDKHVSYIQTLDTVRTAVGLFHENCIDYCLSGEMSSSIG